MSVTHPLKVEVHGSRQDERYCSSGELDELDKQRKVCQPRRQPWAHRPLWSHPSLLNHDHRKAGDHDLLKQLKQDVHSSVKYPMDPELVVVCGLCNRLRALLSYRLCFMEMGLPLTVQWESTECCPGFFEDLFEPLSGVVIISRRNLLEGVDWTNHSAHDFHPAIKMRRQLETRCFADLHARMHIQAKVSRMVRHCGERFIALHIRRTDHYACEIGRHTTDREV
jgi:hypothetical protein